MRKNTHVAIDGCCHIAILLLSDYINGTLTIFFDFILFRPALCLVSELSALLRKLPALVKNVGDQR